MHVGNARSCCFVYISRTSTWEFRIHVLKLRNTSNVSEEFLYNLLDRWINQALHCFHWLLHLYWVHVMEHFKFLVGQFIAVRNYAIHYQRQYYAESLQSHVQHSERSVNGITCNETEQVCTHEYPKVSGLATWTENYKRLPLSATRWSCKAILWVSLVGFAAITPCVASQQVFIVVSLYFVMTQSGNFWIHPRITTRFDHA
jgi:hypothetical protein